MKKQIILVVDDDREIVRAISKLLELEGYETLKAYDGLEALDILMDHTVHLIIMDVMMPRLNGLSAVMKFYFFTINFFATLATFFYSYNNWMIIYN